jgi:hypothetical protein
MTHPGKDDRGEIPFAIQVVKDDADQIFKGSRA